MSKSRGNEPSSPTRSGPAPLRQPVERPTGTGKRKKTSNMDKLRAFAKRPTIGTLRSELSHVLQWVLVGFILIFLVGALYSFAGASDKGQRDDEETRTVNPVAVAFGNKLSAKDWQARIARIRLDERDATATRHGQLGTMVQDWIRQQAELRLARNKGVSVSSSEVNKEIDKQIKDAIKAQRGELTPKQWRFKLDKEGSSEAKKAAELRAKMLENPDAYEGLRNRVLLDKLRKKIGTEVKVTDADLKKEYDEVSGRVIVLNVPATRPMPLPEGAKPETDEQKKVRATGESTWRKAMDDKKAAAEKLLADVKAAPEKFAEIAKEKSDDFATKKDGGKVTALTQARNQYGDGFKAAFALKKGELSGLLEGNSGWVIFSCEDKKSWPDDFKKAEPRSLEEAKKIADDLAAQLAKGADFAKLASDKSDDPGSAKKGGDLGEFGRRQMVKAFEKMAFALNKDEVSKPFKSQFGYHIMQVTDRVLPKAGEVAPSEDEEETPDPADKAKVQELKDLKELPLPDHKDLAKAMKIKARHILVKGEDSQKKLDDKRQQLEDRRKSELYEKLVEETRKAGLDSGAIVVNDPQLKAAMAQREGKPDQELINLRQAAGMWPTSHADVHYELGQTYDRSGGFGMGGDVQVAAIKAISKDPKAVPGLIEVLDSMFPDAVKAACNALGELKAKEAASKLTDVARTSQDDLVVQAAGKALEAIGAPVPPRAAKAAGRPSLEAPGAAPKVSPLEKP